MRGLRRARRPSSPWAGGQGPVPLRPGLPRLILGGAGAQDVCKPLHWSQRPLPSPGPRWGEPLRLVKGVWRGVLPCPRRPHAPVSGAGWASRGHTTQARRGHSGSDVTRHFLGVLQEETQGQGASGGVRLPVTEGCGSFREEAAGAGAADLGPVAARIPPP